MVDSGVSKAPSLTGMSVRVRPPAPSCGTWLAMQTAVIALALAGGCAMVEMSDETADSEQAISGLTYHCVVTGEDPEGPDVWLAVTPTKVTLSRTASFHTRYSGTLDTTYKPTERVNMDRFLGFANWALHGTTKVYILKALETEGGEGDIFVDMVTTKFTEVVYACDLPG